MTYLLIAIFGAAGAVARYAVDGWISDLVQGRFPWGTMAVNLLGCFALGLVVALTTERLVADPGWRTAIGIGFLGAFTTFSTYAYETLKLAEDGVIALALANCIGMVVLGLVAGIAGLALGRAL